MSSGESDVDDSWFIVNPEGDVINLVCKRNSPDPAILQNDSENQVEPRDDNDVVVPSMLTHTMTDGDTVLPLPDSDMKKDHDDNLPLVNTTINDQNDDDDIISLQTREGTSGIEVKTIEVIPQYDESQCCELNMPRLRFSAEKSDETSRAKEKIKQRQNSSSSDISLIDEQSIVVEQSQNFATDAHMFLCAPPPLVFPAGVKPSETKEIETRNSSSQTVRRMRRLRSHQSRSDFSDDTVASIIYIAVGLFIALIFSLYYMKYKNKAPSLAQNLEAIHGHILACLGEQHLAMIQSNETQKFIYLVCENTRADYRQKILGKLTPANVHSFFDTVQKMIYENDAVDVSIMTKTDLKELNIHLMVLQLEYYEWLPDMLKKPFFRENTLFREKTAENPPESKIVLNQFEEVAKNLTSLSQELKHVISVLLADETCQIRYPVHGGNTKGSAMDEIDTLLDVKLQNLYDQYKSIAIAVEKLKKESETSKQGTTERLDTESKSYAPLQDRIDLLTRLQENTLKEVSNLYQLLFDGSNPKIQSTDHRGWSLEMLKKNVESYIQEAHAAFKETVEDYPDDVSKVLTSFVQEGKKHAEDTLNIVTDYFKEAEEGARNILKEQLPETIVKGFWDVWEKVKYKMPSSNSDDTRSHPDNNEIPTSEPTGKGENVQQPEARPESYPADENAEIDSQSNDWFFERAAGREKGRDSPEDAVNWYLARERLREMQRKRNEDQKQKAPVF